jgi:DNA-directed RNA polymerase II subunit RPB1
LIQNIYNLYGMRECTNFLNSTQHLINQYLTRRSFTISFGDCRSPKDMRETVNTILEKNKKSVEELIQKAQQGLYETKIDEKYIQYSLELDIRKTIQMGDDEVSNHVSKHLYPLNGFKVCVDSGSKGNKDNIQKVFSYFGQLDVNGHRVQNGYTDRTLPHFCKNDISMAAKGFIPHSFTQGTLAHEYYFGSIAAREGQVGKSIQTGDAGYVSRRLMKGMEDLKINYDATVRNTNDVIVQFVYGNDGFEASHLELQRVQLIEHDDRTMQDIFQLEDDFLWNYYLDEETFKEFEAHKESELSVCATEWTELMEYRRYLREDVFPHLEFVSDAVTFLPVHFDRFLHNVSQKFNLKSGEVSNVLPSYVYEQTRMLYKKIIHFYRDINNSVLHIAKILIHDYLSIKRCLKEYRMTKVAFDYIIQTILHRFLSAIVAPGEAVGPLAAQTIGEVNTQLSMKSVHGVGKAIKLTSGVQRLNEILKVSKHMKTPSMKIYLKSEYNNDKDTVKKVRNKVRYTKIEHLIRSSQILYLHPSMETSTDEETEYLQTYFEFNNILGVDPVDTKTLSPWTLYLEFEKEDLIDKQITMADIQDAILMHCNSENDIQCIFNDDNSSQLMIRIRLKNDVSDSNNILFLKELEKQIIQMKLKGITGIIDCNTEEMQAVKYVEAGKAISTKETILRTHGSNLYDILTMEEVDFYRTMSNNIVEVYEIFGIEAARNVLIDEMYSVVFSKKVGIRHFEMLADLMTYRGGLMQIDRHGINRSDDNGFIAKASFEEVTDIFVKAAVFAEKDKMQGVSASIMMGQLCPIGTNYFDVLLDEDKIRSIPEQTEPIQQNNRSFKKTPNYAVRAKAQEALQHVYTNTPAHVANVKETVFDSSFNIQSSQDQKIVFQKPVIEDTNLALDQLDSMIDSLLGSTEPSTEQVPATPIKEEEEEEVKPVVVEKKKKKLVKKK